MAAPIGNHNAKRAKRWQKAIERALSRASNSDIDAGLDKAADMLVSAAYTGDQWALKELGDRMDGKSVQPIAGDDDSPPISFKGVIDLVRPTE
jgi:hypothetical protein